MEDHELQALRPLDSGGECGAKQNHEGVKEENGGSEITHAVRAPLSSPSIRLALSVHPDSTDEKFDRSVTIDQQSDCWLTPIQSLELGLQTHIYKHLAGGLPLPLHLASPLWKNVATYLGSTKSAIYHNDQSCIEFGSEELKHKYMADPESVRCRRTDGKKWRCRKNSIPEQKYCERHIHRGRQCSRKPVEENEINSPSMAPARAPSRILHSQSESKNSIFSAPVKLITTSIVTESTANLTRGNPTTFAGENEITGSATNNNEGCYNKGRTDFYDNKSGNGPKIFDNGQSSLTLGLGFSPRSVLQVLGKNSAFFVSKTGAIEPELEPERCRRTDGKKWRCSRGRIPDQKYCGIHMHRGSIKKFKSYHNDVSLIPNTNLSMSIQPSHRPKRIKEKNSSSSGSETTISDTTVLC